MSLGGLLGGGGSDFNYTPQPAPPVPWRGDAENQARATEQYKHMARLNSYTRTLLTGAGGTGAGAGSPAKSYAAQVFNAGGGGGM